MLDIVTNEYKTLFLQNKSLLLDNLSYKKVELDLGCGKGGFSIQLAKKYPKSLIIAADVMLGRLRKLNNKSKLFNLNNLHLLRASAIELLGYQFPDAFIDRIHLLCPDPWPKNSHRSKRLVSSNYLGQLSMKLKIAGVFHFSTDSLPYLSFFKEAIKELPFFLKDEEGISDILDLKTDFENRWLKSGLKVTHLSYKRIR